MPRIAQPLMLDRCGAVHENVEVKRIPNTLNALC